MHQLTGLPWLDADAGRAIADRVAHDLARKIVEGEIAPGSWLTELEVATEAGVSRTPVREAMLRLQAWGLLQIAPKKGAIVTVPTARERHDLLAVRTMLETEVIRRIATDHDLRSELARRLREIVARQHAAVQHPARFALEDYAFHAEIIHFNDNRVVDEVAGILGPRLARLTHLAVSAMQGQLHLLAEEHATLAAAVESGTAESFVALIEAHLAAGHSRYELAL